MSDTNSTDTTQPEPPGDEGRRLEIASTDRKAQWDPDAAWGTKTRKNGGEESFYGYHEHTLVRVPDRKQDKDDEPRLIVRTELTPASKDVVEVSLSLLDRLKTSAEHLIVDRLYPYAAPNRWRDELHTRGISQVFDLRSDQHGFIELDHMRWAAGHPHCPATPDEYGTIPRPGPTATAREKEIFRRKIHQRQEYAFRRVTSPDADGTARWECPAVAGSIGCPLRKGTVEVHLSHGAPSSRIRRIATAPTSRSAAPSGP